LLGFGTQAKNQASAKPYFACKEKDNDLWTFFSAQISDMLLHRSCIMRLETRECLPTTTGNTQNGEKEESPLPPEASN